MELESLASESTDLLTVTLDPYQQRAVDWLSGHFRALVVSSAGSGKTIIAAAAIQKVVRQKTRILPVRVGWLANTIEQCNQAREALEKFPGNIQANVACAAADMDWSDRDVLIVDECHHLPATTWREQASRCGGAIWGFSATPFGADPERNQVIRHLFQNNILTIDRSEVSSRLVPAKVVMLSDTDPELQEPIDREIERTMKWREKYWKGELWKLLAIVTWQTCIKRGIINNDNRNRAVLNLASKHKDDHVLVLVNEVDHGKKLADSIAGAVLCHSKMGSKSRRETIERFKSGGIRCLVTTSMLEEGFDAPRANVIIMVSGGKSSRKAEQATGRVLRSFAHKTHGTIYDFYDLQHTTMAKHSANRVNTYRKLGYAITNLTAGSSGDEPRFGRPSHRSCFFIRRRQPRRVSSISPADHSG